MKLLSRLNRIQQLTLAVFVILVANRVILGVTGYSPFPWILRALLVVAFIVLLLFATLPPVIRKITWRVRNRLILTYVLVGVLPLLLISIFVQLGFHMVLGQTANYILRQELDRRLEQLYKSAEYQAQVVLEGKESSSVSIAGAGTIVRTSGRPPAIPEDAPVSMFPAWTQPGFKGIVRNASGSFFLAAHAEARDGNRHVDVFSWRALDNSALADLLPGLAAIQVIEGVTVRFRIGTYRDESSLKLVLDSEEKAPPPPSRGFWDRDIETGSTIPLQSLENGQTLAASFLLRTHPSAVLARVFSTLGNTAPILGFLMAIIAATFVVVEIAAVVACVKLARTLTRTVHELYAGTKRVEKGDFAHRIPVRAKDQLSELASSFNGMTLRVEQLIEEVKEKEKLESELEIARQVQAQLFPKEVPKLATLELVGVCNPARVVSGDYYDFIPIESRGAAVVIGDISGKGISAALLMASVQASLHAQLAMGNDADLSTATLVTRLNRQLYENTPPEKYATFYCAVYDDRNSRLTYTNAGHLAPILIRNGQVLRLESNGTVVGMFAEYPFEQCDVDLQPGDLLVAFTDGITESENAKEEQFGEERLIELVSRNAARPLSEILQTVMDTVGSWAHDPSTRDDITMLLARKL